MTFAKSILSLALLLRCICLTSSKPPVSVTGGLWSADLNKKKFARKYTTLTQTYHCLAPQE